MVRNVVENHIVTLPAFGEIFFGVINDVIRAERSNHIHISRTAYTGHIRAERFRDLDRERPNTSGRAVNQHLLSRLNLSFVPKSLQRRDASYVDRSGLLKCQIGRLQGHASIRTNAYVLAESSSSSTEHLVTWFELCHGFADCFNRPRKVNAQSCVLWLTQPNPEPHDLWRAFDEMPVVWIDGGRANFYQDLIVIWDRLFNVF